MSDALSPASLLQQQQQHSEWVATVANFDHFKSHVQTFGAGVRTWRELRERRALQQCLTCKELCDQVDRRLRERFVRKRWKGREPATLEALEHATAVRFEADADGLTCSAHSLRRPNSDQHPALRATYYERCEAHERETPFGVVGEQPCGCRARQEYVCFQLMPRMVHYRHVMCLRQLLTLEYRDYKEMSLQLASEAGSASVND
jgi:hypothetical protein